MKKGFTLIETVLTISIILMVTAYGLLKTTDYNKMKVNLDVSLSKSMILALINDGKEYCRMKHSSGYVLFNKDSQIVGFYSEGRKVDGFNMPSGVKIYNINSDLGKVRIDNTGFTSDACTINLKDNNNNIETITICVGTGYAEIQ